MLYSQLLDYDAFKVYLREEIAYSGRFYPNPGAADIPNVPEPKTPGSCTMTFSGAFSASVKVVAIRENFQLVIGKCPLSCNLLITEWLFSSPRKRYDFEAAKFLTWAR